MDFVVYDTAGGIIGFGPSPMFPTATTNSFAVTNMEWQDYLNNPKNRKIDILTLKIVTCETIIPTKKELLDTLDATYQPQFTAVTQAYLTALTAGDTQTATARQADYVALKSSYTTALGAIS